MAYIITLANGKGGVAKTTTCISLGSALAKMGYRVLLIDLDPSANLTAGLGILTEQSLDFSQDLFLPDRARIIRPTQTAYQNLDIIPSKGELTYEDGHSSSSYNSRKDLRRALEALSPNPYDLIILDCPASLGFLTISALTASDLLIIPTQPEYFSTLGLPTMFSVVNKIREGNNPGLKYHILVSMLDLRLKEHRDILGQLQMWLRDSLYKTRIQVDTHIKESQSQGIPINYARPFSRSALQYYDLAFEIVQELNLIPILSDRSSKVAFGSQTPSQPATHPVDTGQQNQYDENGSFCPHLGGIDDPQTMLAYPSTWNKCYRASPIVSPNYTHQQIYCISKDYHSCPMLRKSSKASLPSDLRAPLDRSELLKYFKDWIKAKIS